MTGSVGGAALDFTVNDKSEAVFARMEANASKTERAVVTSMDKASTAAAAVGEGAAKGAAAVDKESRRLQQSIERTIAALQGGQRGTVAFFESLAKQRGIDVEALRPTLEALRSVRNAQDEAAVSAQALAEKQRAAAAAVAENRRAFEQEESRRQQYLEGLREEIKLLGMSESARRAYKAALANAAAGGGAEGESLLRTLERQRAVQAQAAAAAADEGRKQREAAAAKKSAEEAARSFVASLEREASAIGKSRVELLREEAAMRGVSAQTEKYIRAIEDASKANGRLGVSAGQTAAAMRQLPAQFTDIATQLAGGQNPLLILIQQGGQIRDSFGGLGAALRGIGSVISPTTVAFGGLAAAAGGLAYAIYQGHEQSLEFQRQLILTGNTAQLTEGRFNALARTIAGDTNSAIGDTREALSQLVGSGRVSREALDSIARAALTFSKVTGEPAAKAAETFGSALKDITRAAYDLNLQYNFLSAAQLRQIKELQEQGDIQKAAVLLFDQLNGRTSTAAQNLGYLERALNATKRAWSDFWDAAKGIGRADTIDDQIKDAERQLEALASRRSTGLQTDQRTRVIRERIDLLKQERKEQENLAARSSADPDRTAAAEKFNDLLKQSRSSARQLNDELKNTKALLEKAGASPDESRQILSDITQRSAAFQQSIAAQMASLRNELAAASDEAQRKLADLQSRRAQGLISEVELIERSRDVSLKANADVVSGLQKELGITRAKRESQAEQIAIEGRIADAVREAAGIRQKAENDIAEAVARRRKAAQEFYESEREQGRQETAAFIVAQDNARKNLTTTIFANSRALRNNTEILRLEQDMLGKSASERSLAIQKLQEEIKLRERIEEINSLGFDPDERKRLIEQATTDARRAIDNIATKADVDYVADLLDPTRAKTFGEALTAAFEGAGDSLVRLTNTFQEYAAQQYRLNEAMKRNRDEKGDVKNIQLENALIEQQGKLQISTYASMAGAAKGFFNENTKGYKALQAAETAFRAYQLASDLVKGVSAAAVGIANQAQGDPYTALPRMAIMAAAMASLGFATGFLGKSGGGGRATAEQRQGGAATGRVVTPDQLDRNSVTFVRGTVLGDDEARSDSIKNSLEILKETAGIHTPILSQMRDALLSIENSPAGLGNLLIRSVNGGLTTGKNLGIRTGTLSVNRGDPILDAIGLSSINDTFLDLPIIGGVLEKLQGLWGKTTQEIVDSGLSLVGTFGDLMVQQFADVKTTSSSFFGLRKKTSESTVFGDVEADIAKQFELVFKGIGDALVSSASILGRDGEALRTAIEAFAVDIPRLSLKDLKGEELQDAINAAIGSIADDLASTLLPGLGDFQKVGEGYFETLIRVASGIETANYELELLGITAINVADVARKQGDVAAEIVKQSIVEAESITGTLSSVGQIVKTLDGAADDIAATYRSLLDVRTALVKVGESGDSLTTAMIRGAGGLDKLASALDVYFTEFFSEQERAAANAAALAQEFARLGLEMPATHAEFRALAEALNDGTEAGAALFAKVIGLADAFDDVADAAAEAAQEVIDRWRDIMSGLDSVVADFLSGNDLVNFQAGRIKDRLFESGFNFSVEEILGVTKDGIRELWEAVGPEGKAAILEVYPAWVELQETIRDTKIKDLIEGIADSEDDLVSAYRELVPEADTLVEAWRKNRDEIKYITEALNELAGVKAGTAVEQMVAQLQEAVSKRDRLRDVISGNRDTALDILASRGTQEGVDALRKREAELWKEFASTQDPEVAQAITKVTLDRIRLEGTVAQKALQARYDAEYKAALAAFEVRQQTITLEEQARETQMDALRDQIDAAKRLKDLAKDLPAFIGGLRAGNLSNLSFSDRLAQQKALFEDALKTGNDPQGQLTAYLQQAQQMFGGATKLYSDIFVQAVAQYEQAIRDGAAKADPAIAAAQAQLNALEALVEKAPELQQAVVDTSQAEIDALLGPGGLNERFGLGLTNLDTSITGLKTALQTKLDELKSTVQSQEATIKEVGAEVIAIREHAKATADNTGEIADSLELAGAAPPDRRISGR